MGLLDLFIDSEIWRDFNSSLLVVFNSSIGFFKLFGNSELSFLSKEFILFVSLL
jgi:hypothetical protein